MISAHKIGITPMLKIIDGKLLAVEDAIKYIVNRMKLQSDLIIEIIKTIIMHEENDSEVLKWYRIGIRVCNDDFHFILSAIVNHIERSPENEIEANAEFALDLLNIYSKNNHDPEDTSLYSAKSHFILRDYKNCFTHLNKYCKLTNNKDYEPSLIVIYVPKSEIPQIEKYVSDSRKKGYSVFIKEIDEKEKRRLVYGVLYDSNLK